MFRNKEYILTILKEGGFSRAAEKLYISQPSLSASVKRIENKISAPIFNRTTPVTLTQAGEMYVKYALEIDEKERDFERFMSDYINLAVGTVKIGGSSLVSSFVLPNMISEFSKQYPRIKFEIFEDNTKILLQKLIQGEVDIIIDDVTINDENISPTVGISEVLLLAVPRSFKVNERLKDYRLTASDIKAKKHRKSKYITEIEPFANEPFILLNPENGTGRRANSIFKKHGINPNVIFYLDQQVTAYNTAGSGMGITLVSDTLVKNIDANSALYYYVLSDKEVIRDIYFYNKSNRYLSVACRKFIDFNLDMQNRS